MSAALSDLKVLIVDDNRFIVGLLKRYLQKLGISVLLEAHDGESALASVDSAAVDVVLCDLSMPGMDGVEFLRHLAGRQTPAAVIVLSGQERSIPNTVQTGRASCRDRGVQYV